jgi:hypothetical protein
MYIHLEAGTCSSGSNLHYITELAYECWARRHYTTGRCEGYHFECRRCEKEFTTVSGMFQHVESDSCSASLDDYYLAALDRHVYAST